jgi:multicomponent Na+:H+ antiporter subunit E
VNAFLLNLILALVWAAMTGRFEPLNVAFGFAIGYGILYFAQPVVGRSSYFVKVRQVGGFALFYLWELVLANLRIAHDVVTPRLFIRPAVLAVPLDARSDEEITVFANLLAMTPGTLVLDVADDRSVVYVYVLYVDDPEAARREIKEGFERRVLELLR